MSERFASHLPPAPVSTRIHFPAARISSEFMAIRIRLRASAGETFSHIGLGITPNIAPPSRRNVPSVMSQNSRSPSFMQFSSRHRRGRGVRARRRRDPFGGRQLREPNDREQL